MGTLYFEKFDPTGRHAHLAVAEESLRKCYATNGGCTHVAFTDLGEVAFAFPTAGPDGAGCLAPGERFVALCTAADVTTLSAGSRSEEEVDFGEDFYGAEEWTLESTDAELEDGIRTSVGLM